MKKANIYIAASLVALSAALAGPARAQDSDAAAPAASAADDEQPGAGEIIVTAERRSQSVNKLGLSITAISGDDLLDRGISSAADLAKAVPGFVYTPTPYNTPVYTLRGVGYFDNSLAASPAVSVYVDEVPLTFPAMTQAAALDLERVEVLKGPQGTLYGQNSTGGAINFIAAKPPDTLEAGATVSIARFGQLDASGYVSGPLSDTLRARLAVKSVQGGAWQESATRPGGTLGDSRQTMGRLLLDWTPSERLQIAVNLNAWHDGSDTLAGQVTAVIPTNPARVSPLLQVQNPLDARHADWTPSNPMRANDTYYEASVRADYDLSDTVKLTSISAYQHFKQDKHSDLDGSPARAGEFHQTGSIDSFSQELRAAGDMTGMRWIVGGNYAHAKIHDDLFDDLSQLSITEPLPGIVPPFDFSAAATKQILNSYALFGNVEVDVAPRLTVIGGLRQTWANRDFNGCTVIVDPNAAALVNTLQFFFKGSVIPVGLGDCGSLDANNDPNPLIDSLKEKNLSYRAAVNYKFDGGTLLYASVNRGYKSGGYPVLLTLSTDSFASIPQERLVAYEAGLKVPLFDRKLQFNAAAFWYDYKNKQLHGRTVDPFFGLIEKLVSVPKSRVAGAEVSIEARPVTGLDISLAATWVDTKVLEYTGFNAAGALADYRGSAFPNTSKYQVVGDAQYSFPIDASGLSAFIGGGVNYASAQSATFGSEPVFRIRPYTLIDLRAGLEGKDGAWRASIWGRNITNEYYWNGIFQASDNVYRQPARPATFGATFSVRFQ